MSKSKKEIIKRLEKICVCCGHKIKVILYQKAIAADIILARF